MKIIGAGMSGMLAGQYFRHMNPVILEKQETLPNNHKALLRFRSDAVSQLTGIPFKKVNVTKMINYKEEHHTQGNIFLNNMYSHKVTGSIRGRSLMNLKPGERYIAPSDFIQQLSYGLNIEFDHDARMDITKQIVNPDEPIISTMPVYLLADMLDYKLDTELKSLPIWTMTFDITDIDCDVYQTVYYPNPKMPLYRLSITGSKVIAEFCRDPMADKHWGNRLVILDNILHFLEIDFGITEVFGKPTLAVDLELLDFNRQRYGKLVACSGNQVREFMGFATHEFNIYSLGRWGTHRQLLMDDVVSDLKIIGNMIRSNKYRR